MMPMTIMPDHLDKDVGLFIFGALLTWVCVRILLFYRRNNCSLQEALTVVVEMGLAFGLVSWLTYADTDWRAEPAVVSFVSLFPDAAPPRFGDNRQWTTIPPRLPRYVVRSRDEPSSTDAMPQYQVRPPVRVTR